jgi:hypothetical protein
MQVGHGGRQRKLVINTAPLSFAQNNFLHLRQLPDES